MPCRLEPLSSWKRQAQSSGALRRRTQPAGWCGRWRCFESPNWFLLLPFSRPAGGTYDSVAAITLLLVVEIAWTAALFGFALRRGWFTRAWMLGDVGLQAAVTIFVGRLCADGLATQGENWSVAPLVGAALLATLFLGRAGLVATTSILALSYLIGVWTDVGSHWSSVVTNLAVIAGFTWAAAMVGGRLLSDARAADVASREVAAAEQRRARIEARYDERTRQYRRLHDTVLSTLEGIARGGLDHAAEAVRRRCGSDASLVRSLSAAVDDNTELSPLPVVLADVIHAVEAFGIKIHQSTDGVPHWLPADVVDAAAGAVREALNNVDKHAHVMSARVTTVGIAAKGIRIRIVDQGVGLTRQM